MYSSDKTPTWCRRRSTARCGLVGAAEGWARIRTADDYTGWTPLSALLPGKAYAAAGAWPKWRGCSRHLSRAERNGPCAAADRAVRSRLEVVAEPPAGALAPSAAARRPRGWVQAGDVAPTRNARLPEISSSATLSGTPYTWGGTSCFGYDCSGFAQIAGAAARILMPRDAHRRPTGAAGRPSSATIEAGDLLYFGGSAKKITHTGVYLGDGKFIDPPPGRGRGADRRFERRPLVAAAGGDARVK